MPKRLTATLEDYLGMILRFQREKHFARVSDIASEVGVAKSAVTAALQKLSAEGLINYQPYEPVTLTTIGEKRAEDILLRHRVILDFLRDVLGVESKHAESIACDMEHAIDRRTLEKFVCFLAFIATRPPDRASWLDEFQTFTKGGTEGHTCRECMQKYVKNLRSDVHES
jgi:DtxR family Mn-dependent transcriptional regulator